jgi:arylsulfatase A-like enzyme
MKLFRSESMSGATPEGIKPLHVAVCFALAAGLIEAAILLFRRDVLHQFVWSGTEVVWMSPVSYLLFLIPVGLVFSLPLLSRWPNATRAALVFLLASVIAFVLAEVAFGARIHVAARLILSVGLGVQLARLAINKRPSFDRVVRRATPVLAAIVLLLGLSVQGWRVGNERVNLAQLPAPRSGAPNVLFIILDTVRAATMSLYGYEQPTTPHLEAFARRSITFDRAIVTAPWTLPSHASMFTGYFPHEMSAGWLHPLDDSQATLAEAMQTRGYATAAFTANFYFTTPETGLDRGFLRFEVYPRTLHQIVLSSGLGQKLEEVIRGTEINERRADRKTAAEVNREFLNWSQRRRDRPFFAVLNYFDAHQPYHAVSPFREKFGKGNERRYASSIAYLDDQLGRLFRQLDEDGVLENTIVIVTSDHGELFGEGARQDTMVKDKKCPCGHGGRPFFPVLHVPLLVSIPGGPGNMRVSDPVSLRDLPATVLDLIGAESSHRFPGESLAHYWMPRGRRDSVPVLTATRTESVVRLQGDDAEYTYSLVADTMHYIRYPDGTEQLFNHRKDPDERNDMATTAPKAQLQHFRALLRSLVPDEAGPGTTQAKARAESAALLR